MLVGVTNKFNPQDLIQISVKGLLNQIYSQQGIFSVKDMAIDKGLLYQIMFDRDGHDSTLISRDRADWENYYVNDILRVEFDSRVSDLRIYFDMSYDVMEGGGMTYMDIPITEPELIGLIRGKKLEGIIGD